MAAALHGLLQRLSAARGARPRRRPAQRRIVAIIGNEGAVFLRFTHRGIAERCYVPMPDPDGDERIRALFDQDRSAPVTVLIDLLEQHYREATLPEVGWFDRRKLLNRKLAQAYGTDHLTTALPISPGTAGATAQERSGRRMFLIGVPESEELRAWLEIVLRAGHRIDALALLPVECVGLVRALCGAGDDETAEGPPAWQVLILRQRASGFRQIILHNGELVFTRLTPNLEVDAAAEEVAENIETEFRSTLSYLRRLSYTDADRLQLTILAEPEVARGIQPRRMRIRDARILTPADAAKALGLPYPPEEASGYTDPLVALWFASQGQVRLGLQTPQLRQAMLTVQVPRVARLAAAGGGALAVVYGGWLYLDLRAAQDRLARMQAERQAVTRELRAREDRLDMGEGDLDRMALVLAARDGLAQAAPVYAPALQALAGALAADMVVTTLRLEPTRRGELLQQAAAGVPERIVQEGFAALQRAARDRGRVTGRTRDGGDGGDADGLDDVPGAPGRMEAVVRLLEPPRDRQTAVRRYERLRAVLAEALPRHDVRLVQPPFSRGRDGSFVGSGGLSGEGASDLEKVEGVYRFEGPK